MIVTQLARLIDIPAPKSPACAVSCIPKPLNGRGAYNL